ncbi:unnamed protein product [Rotaria magnacalcarata]|uniref:Citrate transport protein n=1 Tax=Rotaria magnacalcarata TaxID=392030 RepID=A0A816LLN7_9BILA|nr:unnamed protein product [Rotaria magnacalcarata]CAF1598523.1 unnamed protein product [Rotaria magnacalcarata]CAF1960166.1 unnamed protein product [Rotaria magnacalcarata]CAF2105865.1 unnamed protein product [Rotaria magnacalcarata]CAF2109093.1 unnamed protein product [Rotaria magnacalcarata]
MSSPYRREIHAAAAAPTTGGMRGVIFGGITGAIEICITFPTEFVKTQLQLDEGSSRRGEPRKYNGVIDCVKKTVHSRGFFGLYRGLSVLLYGSIPKSAVRFGAFEELKKYAADEHGQLNSKTRLLCGLGAGLAEALLVVTPMETVKVKFIHDQNLAKPNYRGFFHGVREIIRKEGIRGTYQGLTPTLLKQGTNQAIRFFVMETLKEHYRKYTNKGQHAPVPVIITGVFGLIAGAASVFGNTPLDVVKTRMQSLEAAKYKNTFDCAIKILKNEGPLAFYKGTVPRLGRVCADVSITFMIYDKAIEAFNRMWSSK